jgi:leader peptidase (prepilin peptidase)/N-methyltransferase
MRIVADILIIVFGGVVGSFLNVCIYRLPREKSIVLPSSFCPNCEDPIKFYDNIPMLSYILLRGKCRRCGARISMRYPVVEFLTALFFYLLYRKMGLTPELPILMVFVALLVVISFIDLEFQIIPDILSIGGLAAGFLLSFLRPYFTWGDALTGILVGGGVLYAIAIGYQLLAKREGMGGGDIKLLAMIGSFCGLKGVIFSLMAGSVVGTLVGLPLMFVKGENTKYAIPFGPFLSLGALVFIFMGESIIHSFLGFLGRR